MCWLGERRMRTIRVIRSRWTVTFLLCLTISYPVFSLLLWEDTCTCFWFTTVLTSSDVLCDWQASPKKLFWWQLFWSLLRPNCREWMVALYVLYFFSSSGFFWMPCFSSMYTVCRDGHSSLWDPEYRGREKKIDTFQNARTHISAAENFEILVKGDFAAKLLLFPLLEWRECSPVFDDDLEYGILITLFKFSSVWTGDSPVRDANFAPMFPTRSWTMNFRSNTKDVYTSVTQGTMTSILC